MAPTDSPAGTATERGGEGDAMLDSDVDPDQTSDEYRCGVGSWRPAWLQHFANMKAFTFTLSMWSLFGSVNFTYYTSIITQLEREFGLPSSVTGFIKNVDNLGFMATVLIFSHFCRDSNKPRLFSIATVISSSAIFLFAIPHFLYHNAQPSMPTVALPDMRPNHSRRAMSPFTEFCDGRSGMGGDGQCHRGPLHAFNTSALVIFVISMVIQGVAQSPKFSLTLTYMDDNARKNSPQHFSFVFAMRAFSPVLGFMLGAWTTSIYVDLTDPGFEMRDPRWVGAWWLGFVICALCSVVWAIPMLLFPPIIKGSPQPMAGEQPKTLASKAKDMPKALCRLMKNKLFLVMTAGLCFEVYQMGFFTFLPKYLEQYYGITPSMASIIAGTVGAMSWALGPIIGGRVIGCAKNLTPFFAAKFIWCISAFTLVGYAVLLSLPCQPDRWAGNINPHSPDLLLECNSNCSCDSMTFDPICGDDGINYFSPCHAGCAAGSIINGRMVYTDCQCISGGGASSGACTNKCNSLIPYAVVLAMTMLVAGMDKVPQMTLFVRCVDEQDKALSVGIVSAVLQIMSFPAPILFGMVIDSACMVLKGACARGRGPPGACMLYNATDLRFRLHSFVLVTKGVALIFYTVGVFLSRSAIYNDSKRHTGDESTVEMLTIGKCPVTETPEGDPQKDRERDADA